MFRKVSIRNFKSLAGVQVDLGNLTVLVGVNGAGKSSFLQAIELFSWTVRYDSINEALLQNNTEFRDLVFLRSLKKSITLSADLDMQKDEPEIRRGHQDLHATCEEALRVPGGGESRS